MTGGYYYYIGYDYDSGSKDQKDHYYNPTTSSSYDDPYLTSTEIYCPGYDSAWSFASPLPWGGAYVGSVSLYNNIYVIGKESLAARVNNNDYNKYLFRRRRR